MDGVQFVPSFTVTAGSSQGRRLLVQQQGEGAERDDDRHHTR